MSIKNTDTDFKATANFPLLTTAEKFMLRALQIARNGLGQTAPNPMVGAVIVYKNRIIGEGYTSAFGGPHAEVNAINAVADTSLLKSSSLYVTLEPCSHYGKTPPCADLIIKTGIKNVFVGLLDPHEKVAGQGIKKLEAAGCTVEVGILKEACTAHHKRFLTFHTKKRPYIILKWAETFDGFIAPDAMFRSQDLKPYWITNERSRQLVHKWRSEEQAILVGTNTALVDNPKLNLREWKGRPPTRIVVDRSLKVPHNYHLLDGLQPTLILTEVNDAKTYKEGVAYKVIDFTKNSAKPICDALFEAQVQSVIIEGGATTLNAFIKNNLWDEARIFKGSNTFGSGIKAPFISGRIVVQTQLVEDQLTFLINDKEHHI